MAYAGPGIGLARGYGYEVYEKRLFSYHFIGILGTIPGARSTPEFVELQNTPAFAEILGPEAIFTQCRIAEATDPRDKVYGMHALLRLLDFEPPTPDYNKSVAEIYTEMVITIIKQRGRLEILNQVPSGSRMRNLPSWIPDWSDTSDPFISFQQMDVEFCASKGSRIKVDNKLGKGRLLNVCGKIVGAVTSTCRAEKIFKRNDVFALPLEDLELRDLIKELRAKTVVMDAARQWVRVLLSLPADHSPCGDTAAAAFLKSTLLFGSGKKNESELHDALFSWYNFVVAQSWPINANELFDTFTHVVNQKGVERSAFGDLVDDNRAIACFLLEVSAYGDGQVRNEWKMRRDFHRIVEKIFFTGYGFFALDCGYLGVGPRTMEEGDLVVLLQGASHPMVVRRVHSGNGYRLVGPAVAHGLMFGEVWPGDGDCLQDFTLE